MAEEAKESAYVKIFTSEVLNSLRENREKIDKLAMRNAQRWLRRMQEGKK